MYYEIFQVVWWVIARVKSTYLNYISAKTSILICHVVTELNSNSPMTILRDSRLNNFRFSMIATNLGACARIKRG